MGFRSRVSVVAYCGPENVQYENWGMSSEKVMKAMIQTRTASLSVRVNLLVLVIEAIRKGQDGKQSLLNRSYHGQLWMERGI
ncbi:hypothetical protein [Rubripirellula lacrimiformis]|nr:hypothetical protein [Rubripirellula lacrimiformis]